MSVTMGPTATAAESIGFGNVSGLQLFPAVSYRLSTRDRISGYLKYSPIANQFQFLSLENREFATGVAYLKRLNDTRTLIFSFDYSNVTLKIANAVSGTA